MIVETFSIERRFRGPAQSGNGGYVCGRIARHVPGTATVRLAMPPPLETPLEVDVTDGVVRLMSGTTLVGEGRVAELDIAVPAPVSLAAATESAKHYHGFDTHTFPNCFVCGPHRKPGDGLRIFAGEVPGREIVAAPWVVDASLGSPTANEFLWAALDCPSGFALWSPREGTTVVLGQLTGSIRGQVRPGDQCVAMGWPLQVEGRKRFAGSAVYSASGDLVAFARAIWIEVPASAFAEED
ncbi:MAG TPA: hypothetical protein VJS12_23430 [Steroidobacteraceae bacterium]|nr:hypothetical protein [Steroidobacteraceae bacterium]